MDLFSILFWLLTFFRRFCPDILRGKQDLQFKSYKSVRCAECADESCGGHGCHAAANASDANEFVRAEFMYRGITYRATLLKSNQQRFEDGLRDRLQTVHRARWRTPLSAMSLDRDAVERWVREFAGPLGDWYKDLPVITSVSPYNADILWDTGEYTKLTRGVRVDSV